MSDKFNDDALERVHESAHPGGGSTAKLANKDISAKFAALAAQHKPGGDKESVDQMHRRNDTIRAVKRLPPRLPPLVEKQWHLDGTQYCHICNRPVIFMSGTWTHAEGGKVDGRNGYYCGPAEWDKPIYSRQRAETWDAETPKRGEERAQKQESTDVEASLKQVESEPVLIPIRCSCVECKPSCPIPMFMLSTRPPVRVCSYCLIGIHAR